MHRLHAAPFVFVFFLLAAPQGFAAPAAGPFARMAGPWRGVGMITMAGGGQERLRCRANYDVADRGSQMRLNLRCASDSYTFDLAGDVASDGRTISGSWSEASRNATGTVEGRVNGNQIDVAARGEGFAARLSLITRGNQQSVAIRPQGTEVREVAITLIKGHPTTTGSAR